MGSDVVKMTQQPDLLSRDVPNSLADELWKNVAQNKEGLTNAVVMGGVVIGLAAGAYLSIRRGGFIDQLIDLAARDAGIESSGNLSREALAYRSALEGSSGSLREQLGNLKPPTIGRLAGSASPSGNQHYIATEYFKHGAQLPEMAIVDLRAANLLSEAGSTANGLRQAEWSRVRISPETVR